ncbi:transposase [Erysipelothrix aquatica]|uniref:transposase n=1 Tax=Erysipelothrix aquatica TaxID=2683714 RepID=UPI0022A6F3B8
MPSENSLAHTCVDHIHLLVKISLRLAISAFVEYLKGKSTWTIFDGHANLKYR